MSETAAATPLSLLNEGRLADAIEAAKQLVKAKPAEPAPRALLGELMCLAGDFDKADGHLETAMMHAPQAAPNISLVRQLIRAAKARNECLDEGRPPELVGAPTPLLEQQLKLTMALRGGDTAAAEQLALAIDAERPRPSGTIGEAAFADLRDADETWTAFLEVLTSTGKYYWAPFASIESMNVLPPKSPKDLLFASCEMVIRGGPDGTVFLPMLYPGPPGDGADPPSEAMRLGRETHWTHPDDGPVRGVGQRVLLVDGEEKTLHELTDVRFTAPPSEEDQ